MTDAKDEEALGRKKGRPFRTVFFYGKITPRIHVSVAVNQFFANVMA